MLLSMTGYGQGRAANSQYEALVELKSVNSKYIEVSLKLPSGYFAQELELRNRLQQKLVRGKVNATLTVTALSGDNGQETGLPLDLDLMNKYYRALESVRLATNAAPVALHALLHLPGVVQESERSIEPAEWDVVLQALDRAADALTASRAVEGKVLETELADRCNALERQQAEIIPLEADRAVIMRQRLTQAIAEWQATSGQQANQDRLEQELIYYLEKNDVTEERVRLTAHIALFRDTMADKESQGRKLGFISQELGREINTLGAKAYHSGIQRIIVQMKDELEKIKEQTANIL